MTVTQENFWSRRKAKVAAEAAVEHEIVIEPDPELSDAEILASLELPDPDTFSLGDDIKGFMSKAVPEHLRRRALRRLWRLNPVLANLDGLNDYDGDFTDAATVVKGMKTAYQVGKGMLVHVQEVARQAESLLEQEIVADDPVEMPQEVTPAEPVAVAEEPEVEVAPAARPRMRFSYDQDTQTVVTA